MKKKTADFAFIFVPMTIGNYFFFDHDIWSTLFVAFFTGLILAFVFFPLMQKPFDHLMKKLSENFRRTDKF